MASINPYSTTSSSPTTTNNNTTSQNDPEAPLSLDGIARRHCREELYISPIRWTDLHTKVLNISFHGPYAEPETASSAEIAKAKYSEESSGMKHLRSFFNFYFKFVMREQGIWNLITTDSSPLII